MDAAEMKQEISSILNRLPDEALAEAMKSIQAIERKYTVNTNITGNLDHLLKTNENLLKRLA